MYCNVLLYSEKLCTTTYLIIMYYVVYFKHIFTETKKYSVQYFRGYYSVLLDLNMLSMTTKKSNAYAARSCQP